MMAAWQPKETTVTKPEVHKKTWLVPRDADTHSYVSYTQYKGGGLDIRIASCDRNADLYFYEKKGLKKLDKLIDILTEARDEFANRME